MQQKKKMSESARLAKNEKIKQNGIKTRARRSKMKVSVVDLKIVSNKMSRKQKEALTRMLLEYKWIRNSAIANSRFDNEFLAELNGEVSVKTPTGFEQRKIEFLGSQARQALMSILRSNLKTLSSLKNKGRKVGRLKFSKECRSIDLPQYKRTYELYPNTSGKLNKARIQNVPGRLRVRGFEQLNVEGIEFANAKLVRRADGFHLLVTTFRPKTTTPTTGKIGVDFGIKTQFSLSDGCEFNFVFEEPERLRLLHKKLSRQKKGSNGYKTTQQKIIREYERLSNRKNEQANQFVHKLTNDNIVYFQDENISSWRCRNSGSRGSKKIHHGIMGRVKDRLRASENAVMLPKSVATTAWCPACGNRTKHSLNKRIFKCGFCAYSADRDLHAATNMILLGERLFTSGTEGCAGGGSARLPSSLYEPVKRPPVKPETSCASDEP